LHALATPFISPPTIESTMKKLAVCALSTATIVLGGTFLATPARGAAALGPCPPGTAMELTAIAEKQCKREGKDYLITYMNCVDGVGDIQYICV
jgi:hypothetical protein